jgi:hypothetical protein
MDSPHSQAQQRAQCVHLDPLSRHLSANDAAGARTIIDDQRLPPSLRELLCQHPRQNVECTAMVLTERTIRYRRIGKSPANALWHPITDISSATDIAHGNLIFAFMWYHCLDLIRSLA